jgi:hypothetical protein
MILSPGLDAQYVGFSSFLVAPNEYRTACVIDPQSSSRIVLFWTLRITHYELAATGWS